jgi:hypothetical protein
MPLTSTVRPPLTLPLVVPVTNSPDSSDFLEGHPGGQALGGVAADDGVAVAVFHRDDGHGDEFSDLDFEFTLVALELRQGHVGFGLQAGVDDHEIVLDTHHFGGDDLANAGFRAFQGFFKQIGKRFRHCNVRMNRGLSC